jgi:hypothetical protein
MLFGLGPASLTTCDKGLAERDTATIEYAARTRARMGFILPVRPADAHGACLKGSREGFTADGRCLPLPAVSTTCPDVDGVQT